jgi:hypothetical protein
VVGGSNGDLFLLHPIRVVINKFTVKLVDPIVGHTVSTMN